MLGTILLTLLLVLFVGALPLWRYSRAWGYAPSGLVTAALLMTFVMVASNQI